MEEKGTILHYRDMGEGELGTSQEVHGVTIMWNTYGELVEVIAPGRPQILNFTVVAP